MDKPTQPRRMGRPLKPGGPLSSTERTARARAKRRRVDVLLNDAESAALDTLTASGQTVRDAVGGAIVRATLSPADLNLLRQWFNAVQDANAAYLEPADYALAVRIHEVLGVPAPVRVVQAAQDKED